MMRKVLQITDGVAAVLAARMEEPINLEIIEGEQIAIVGDNAAGKTHLAEIIAGQSFVVGDAIHYDWGQDSNGPYVSDNVKYITFKDSYGAADGAYYLQQRWNQIEINEEDTPTVGHQLGKAVLKSSNPDKAQSKLQELMTKFGLDALRDKYTISLSSGELRKFQLTKVLINSPHMLVIDNPYIGLDAATRTQLSDLLAGLAAEGITVVLVMARPEEIPEFITHVIPVDGMRVTGKITKAEFVCKYGVKLGVVPQTISSISEKYSSAESDASRQEILKFSNVTISYSDRTILKDLDWCVRKGEHWALSGQNGSGKSTLLSLVCADNPQAYACHIELFGRLRGTGESIWEIKEHIGYVSPEMHRSYVKDIPAQDIVASGLFDTVGLFRKVSDSQRQISREWMQRFGIEALAQRSFMKLSSGEQRLCLLARAFVKQPSLLILDEPLHGLDEHNRQMVKDIIDDYCSNPDVTMVMVTHYIEELPQCIDHSLFLKRN